MAGVANRAFAVGNASEPALANGVALHRRVVVRLSLLMALMAVMVSSGALMAYVLSASSHALIGEVAAIGRLRMLVHKTSLSASRHQMSPAQRVALVNSSGGEFEQLLERFHQPGNPLAELRHYSTRVSHSLADLLPEWNQFHNQAIALANSGLDDPQFDRAGDALLARAELLIGAVKDVSAERHDRFAVVLFAISVASLMLLVLFWHVVRRIVIRPITALVHASERLAIGDLASRVNIASGDELGLLGRAFNAAGERIEDMVRRNQEQECLLTESETRHRLICETCPDAIVMIDTASTIHYANTAVATVFGYAPDELIGRHVSVLQPEHLRCAHSAGFARYLASGEQRVDWRRIETQALTRAGQIVEVDIAFTSIEFKDGPHFAAFFRDVTDRKQAERALQHNATHDSLTNLPNRALMLDRLAQAIAVAERRQGKLAVLFLDLDNFKYVNDGYGHSSGDELIKEVAARILLALREGDTVARLGGDEFVLLLDDISDEIGVGMIGERLLQSLQTPITLECGNTFIGASIGAAMYPRDGDTPALLLKNADTAMYRAKDQGRGNMQFFTQELQAHVQNRNSIEGALRRALENDEFELHFQAKATLADGRLAGCEALIRWRCPSRGLVPPAEFIAVAEETGLIVPIGDWVIEAACAASRRWRDAGISVLTDPEFSIAINLSARQFRVQDLPQRIAAALERHHLESSALELEITESMTMQNPDEAIVIMHRLKELGIRLAMDDFGTGYSSLAYLKRFPIDILKVDRSFICDTPDDAEDNAITGAIISLAHSLGLRVVAEGVEKLAQLNFLHQLGCNMIQGYLLARPLPSAEFERLIGSGSPLPLATFKPQDHPVIRIISAR